MSGSKIHCLKHRSRSEEDFGYQHGHVPKFDRGHAAGCSEKKSFATSLWPLFTPRWPVSPGLGLRMRTGEGPRKHLDVFQETM